MNKRYIAHITFILIIILWIGMVAPKPTKPMIIVEERKTIILGDYTKVPYSNQKEHIDLSEMFDFHTINDIRLLREEEADCDTTTFQSNEESIIEVETPTPSPSPTPSPTPEPPPTPTPQSEWKPYLATSYSGHGYGNRGEDLSNRKVIAMWQSDTNYLAYHTMCQEYKDWFASHNCYDFGALLYGTKVEIRVWTGTDYRYMGIYELIDDSPTTQRNLSEVARSLHNNNTKPFYFDYTWTNIDYKGNPANGGAKRGYITNWKTEYNWNVKGWVDVKEAGWGTTIVEMRVVK